MLRELLTVTPSNCSSLPFLVLRAAPQATIQLPHAGQDEQHCQWHAKSQQHAPQQHAQGAGQDVQRLRNGHAKATDGTEQLPAKHRR